MPDRSKKPGFKLTKNVHIDEVKSVTLSHNVPLKYINGGQEDIIKIIVNFRAGSWVQNKRLVSSTTTKMLIEGTKDKTSQQISEIIDFYGADVKLKSGYHYNYIVLTVLNKFLEPLLRLLQEILTQPVFPEDEMRTLLSNQKQDYLIELENVELVARNLYHSSIFGYNHPYGTYAVPEDFDKVERNDLTSFYERFFHTGNMHIVAGGKITGKEIELIDKYLTNIRHGEPTQEPEYTPQPKKEKLIRESKEGSLQSAIQIGNRIMDLHDPDFIEFNFVMTLLGGYFGSRLMRNIREEKGLTYGIWAGADSVSTEVLANIESSVRKENAGSVLEEIGKEIELLKKYGAEQEELMTVKNYVLSQLLKLINGIFPLTYYINYLNNAGLDESYPDRYVEKINNLDNARIMEIAGKYLNFDNFYKIIVG